MKIILLTFLISSLKGPEIVDPPIKNHDDLMVRIEQKFIGFRSPEYGWQEPPKLAGVDWVTPEYRPVVIEYLKNKARDPQYLERAQRALIALDDEDTVVDAIKHFSNDTLNPVGILAQNLRGNRIKYLIPVIYEGSEISRDAGLGRPKTSRYYAIDMSLHLISGSGLFSDSVAQWASGFCSNSYNFGADPHIMWLFQQWWEHNKDAILAEKFSEATWIPIYKGEPDKFGDDYRNEPEYRNYTAATRNDIISIPKHASIVPAIKVLPAVTQAPPGAASTQKDDSIFIFLSLGLLATFAAAWVWFKRAKA